MKRLEIRDVCSQAALLLLPYIPFCYHFATHTIRNFQLAAGARALAEGGQMAIVIRFTAPGLTAAKYDEIVKRLDAAGQGAPAGRLYHVCFGEDKENLHVSDIWDSKESFDKFGETLKPILVDLGIEPQPPAVITVYNTLAGGKAASAS
jgi:hypothetical protein